MAQLKQDRALLTAILWFASVALGGCGGGGSVAGSSVGRQNSASSATATAACTDSTYVPNFAMETDPVSRQPNKLYHWSAFPVRIYFESSDLATPERQAQAQAGFDWWVNASSQTISYTLVDAPSQADITVRFQNRGSGDYGAVTDITTASSRMESATITFYVENINGINSIPPIAAHEFGHALGICGHSNDAGSVMQFNTDIYALTGLSTRDINTLRTAYCGLPDSGLEPAQQGQIK